MVDLIGMIRLIIYAFLLIFILRLIFNYLIEKRDGTNIGNDRLKIMTSGTPNVKKFNLKSLWLSEGGNKRMRVGKIISYVCIDIGKKGREDIINCFVVKRKKMEAPEFYLIPDKDIVDNNLNGDVISTLWNFRLDENSSFFVPNDMKLISMPSVLEGISVSVDTISRVSPLVHASIRANPIHRIRMRESGLIR